MVVEIIKWELCHINPPARYRTSYACNSHLVIPPLASIGTVGLVGISDMLMT